MGRGAWGLGLGAWGLGKIFLKPRASSLEPQASSLKPQASSLEPRASSLEPRASSLEPRTARPLRVDHSGRTFFRGELLGERQDRVAPREQRADLVVEQVAAHLLPEILVLELLEAVEERLREARQLLRILQLFVRSKRSGVIDEP